MNKDRLKPLFALLLIFIAAPLLAALVSPWVYQFLQSFAAEDSLLDAPFHRVTSRIVLLAVALLLVPAYKLSGFKGRDHWGLCKSSSRWKLIGLGLGLGIVSMLIVYLLGTALGVFVWDTRGKGAAYLVRKVIQVIAGGLFIGFFEEILFRGFIQNALKKSLGVIAAVLIGSFFFSIVHFMRPTDPEVVNQWNSGLMLFQNLFGRAGDSFAQEASTLFCMGLVLAMLSHWMKSVYVAIGLHAGWVWVMMFFRLFTQNQRNMVWLYGTSDWVSRAWIGPILALIVLAAVVLTRKKWIALGHAPSTSTT
ncbi:MAG: CPBP family intramembrane metalloprotease [Verrucomicrobia bacterium]|nr:CPBP family intramembrane metalloprotease [Verrucomicrobiota bacterium]